MDGGLENWRLFNYLLTLGKKWGNNFYPESTAKLYISG